MVNSKEVVSRVVGQVCKIPGILESYLSIYDFLGKIPLYDTSWRHLPNWLEMLNDRKSDVDNTTPIQVLFFSVYPYWVDYSLALAVLLAARGANIDFAWMPNFAHLPLVRPPKGYAHWIRLANRSQNICQHPKLKLFALEHVQVCEPTAEMITIAKKQAEKDVSYLLQKERLEWDTNPNDFKIFEYRKKQNLDAITRIAASVNANKYNHVIVPSGGILEFGAIFQYIKTLGLTVSSIENCDVKGKVWASNDASVISIDTKEIWYQDEPHILSKERRVRIEKVIETRENPISNGSLIEYQRAGLIPKESTRDQLSLDGKRPVVLICPNVPFDAIFYVGANKIFSGMWEWLAKTCQYLAARSDCEVVIRSHPAEPHYKTKETTEGLLKEFLPALPSHFTIIPPTASISTYSIMQIADLGIVYASTTGLEMAMRGIPVVCGNSTQHYNQKGFTIDPATQHEYYSQIDRILQNVRSFRLSDRQIELAWCYADVYFNKWYRPFPWQVFTLWNDLKEWSMSRMMSQEGMAKFGEVLSVLCK